MFFKTRKWLEFGEYFKAIIKAIQVDEERCYSKSFESIRKIWYGFIHIKLKDYGFVNGEPKENTWDKKPEAAFWWCIYGKDPQYYRPYYDHHCSSRERKEQMLNFIQDLIDGIKK